MKYWLFDGEDIVGPFSPQELAGRTDFSADSLICAEDQSELPGAWRSASCFDSFRFNAQTRRVESITHQASLQADSLPPAAPSSARGRSSSKTSLRPAKKQARTAPPVLIRLSKKKNPLQPPTPVRLAQEDLELVFPQIPTEEAAPTPAAAQEKLPVPEQNSSTPHPPSPETEIVSTCTLPIVNEILNQSDLPQLPEGEFPEVALPAEPDFSFQAFGEPAAEDLFPPVPSARQTVDETTPAAQEKSALPDKPSAQLPTPQALPQPEAHVLLPSSVERPAESLIEKEFTYTSQLPDEFFLTQSSWVTPSRRKANFVLGILLLLAGMAAGAWWLAPRLAAWQTETSAEAPQALTVQEEMSVAVLPELLPDPATLPDIKVPPPPAPVPVSASEKALAAVQNHPLARSSDTISSYFEKVYHSHLTQGYQASWAVEPLHKSTYIVKYRLTKPRTEPIVYVFQADAANGKLTGALNNVALDLVGKI